MSKFVTRALWEALRKEDEALLQQFLEADKDPGNIEVKQSFSDIEGEDFIIDLDIAPPQSASPETE